MMKTQSHGIPSEAAIAKGTFKHIGMDRRFFLVLGALVLAIFVVAIIQLGYGDYPVHLADVFRAILRLESSEPSVQLLVWTLRMPRIVTALLVGAALSVSGAIMQGLTRNILASPGILGVSGGAAAAVIAWLVIAPESSFLYRPPTAFLGGMVTALLIYLLAWRGGSSPLRLILVGIGIGALTSTVSSLVLLVGDYGFQNNALIWLAGRVSVTGWGDILLLSGWTLSLIAITMLLSRHLNTIGLGREIATGLGVPVEALWAGLVAVSVALTAGSIAMAGIIGFVGLMGPHIARRLVGGRNELLIPIAALSGGLTLLTADLLGRVLGGASDVPAGIVTSVIGAPVFFILLARRRRP